MVYYLVSKRYSAIHHHLFHHGLYLCKSSNLYVLTASSVLLCLELQSHCLEHTSIAVPVTIFYNWCSCNVIPSKLRPFGSPSIVVCISASLSRLLTVAGFIGLRSVHFWSSRFIKISLNHLAVNLPPQVVLVLHHRRCYFRYQRQGLYQLLYLKAGIPHVIS